MQDSSAADAGGPEPSEADEKRARILAAAETVCARSGVGSARMEEIAARAGVSKGTLYRYFESKDDLLVAMVIESYDAGRRAVDARWPSGAGPLAALEHLLDGLSDVLAAHAPRAPVHYAAWEIVASAPALRARLEDYLRSFFEARGAEVRSILEAGRAEGAFRADADLESFTQAILALLSGFVFRSTFDPEGASPARLRAAYRALIHQTLVVGAPAGEKADG